MLVLILISCGSKSKSDSGENLEIRNPIPSNALSNFNSDIIVGANRTANYLPLVEGKRVGIVANQTSVIFTDKRQKLNGEGDYVHIVDSLLKRNVNIQKVFAPEHGFRGTADAGEVVKDGMDLKTGLPIVSLYGNNKKPTQEQLSDLDIIIFDIQDVGARFYTYISSLHYVMEACAEANIPILILDRPNPNGHYIDGPILEPEYQSFVGMHPIPVVHGMTIGEYAKMIDGEGWLSEHRVSSAVIIPMEHYTHDKNYSLPIKPSPNLPNDQAINLYPSLCFFEGTNVNAGRGTSKQFQIYGSPYLDKTVYNFKYIPSPNQGAKYPKHDGVLCYGEDLSSHEQMHQLDLSYLIRAYQNSIDKKVFFNDFFVKLAGTKALEDQIKAGVSEQEIRASWEKGLQEFKKTRAKYLIYN